MEPSRSGTAMETARTPISPRPLAQKCGFAMEKGKKSVFFILFYFIFRAAMVRFALKRVEKMR